VSTGFNPQRGLIVLTARLYGPVGDRAVRVALDTGASATIISTQILTLIGYDPATLPHTVQMTTGSGVEFAPRLTIDKLEALGQERLSFPIIAHTLPASAAIDGLLGLDFFRNQELTIDFRTGQITLRQSPQRYAAKIAGASARARFSITQIGVPRSRSSSRTWRSSRK
jgi:predicted aspartyl protease